MDLVNAQANPRLVHVQELLLGVVVLSIGLLSSAEQWQDGYLVLTLGALAIVTHLLPFTARGVHISGSFMGLVLLMALTGPAPAATVGVVAVCLDALRTRPARWHLVTDLVTYATFPLVGGVLFQVVRSAGVEVYDDGYALAVAGLFLVVNVLNFVLVVEQTRLHRTDLPPLGQMLRGNMVPVLPWQLAAAFVTATAAYGVGQVGLPAVGLLACVLFTFQLLLRAVLEAEHQRDELAQSFSDLGEMHRGLLAAMLNTLSLRDPMTARHSAAVARYALATAEAAGMSPLDQELAHTAGLVHDIGKASFDDGLLHSRGPLSDQQRRIIRQHPSDGARVLRGVQGYEPVADIVESHHERWDGGGYPRGLVGDEIPALARILAVADTYDVMTGRDTYREPVTHADAVAELRRVSGTQLDPRYVELFVRTVEDQHIAFAHADDRDLEVELRRPRTVLA
jgi:putative nucleotidyltransferase with HDIG domain